MKEIKVGRVIIGKQFKTSYNYNRFLEIAKEKNIKIQVVEAGMQINIEKDLYFDILWPDSKNAVKENILNNNSLVCKLVYKNFRIIFTGDIEEIAEKAILTKYMDNLKLLNADILKVAHHGSKTSSIKEFINEVKPKIALIGVGKDNKFGHPSQSTLETLEKIKCEIYRTDKYGEIMIETNGEKIITNFSLKI